MAIDLDTVRVLVGDADADTQLLDDDAMTLIIGNISTTYAAAAAVARAIAAKFSRKTDFRLDSLSFSNSQKAQAYLRLAQQLDVQANNNDSSAIGAIVTGASVAEMDAVEDNTDRVQNLFDVDMQKDPEIKVSE